MDNQLSKSNKLPVQVPHKYNQGMYTCPWSSRKRLLDLQKTPKLQSPFSTWLRGGLGQSYEPCTHLLGTVLAEQGTGTC